MPLVRSRSKALRGAFTHTLTPRDLLDVYDFMWTTLRPKSLQRLNAAKDVATDDVTPDTTTPVAA